MALFHFLAGAAVGNWLFGDSSDEKEESHCKNSGNYENSEHIFHSDYKFSDAGISKNNDFIEKFLIKKPKLSTFLILLFPALFILLVYLAFIA